MPVAPSLLHELKVCGCRVACKIARRLSPSTCLVSSPTFVVEQQPPFVRHCLLRLVFHPPWRLLMLQLLLLLQARFWKLKGYTWREACTQRLPDLVFCNQLILHSNGFDHTPRAWWSLGSSGTSDSVLPARAQPAPPESACRTSANAG